MKNKKAKWFLWICLTLFALSVIACTIHTVASYYEVKADFPYGDGRVSVELAVIVFMCMWVIIPALGSELSFIRSIYHILKHRPKWTVSICYIISACLACLAFVFAWLMLYEVSILPDSMDLMIIIFQWPIFIVSFLLGSVPAKRKEPCDNDRIDLQNNPNIS